MNPAFIPLGARKIPNLVRKESLPPLAGEGAPMKKMLAFFSWVPGKVAAGRKGGYKPSIYPAWRPLTNPVFIPLGGHSQALCLYRLARAKSRTLYGKNPFPACGGRGSHEKNARIFSMGTREGGRRPEGGIQTQCLPRLTTARKPSIYPAWRPAQSFSNS